MLLIKVTLDSNRNQSIKESIIRITIKKWKTLSRKFNFGNRKCQIIVEN